ncbi:MAG: tail fiber domain-containing protein [Candidatus Udaeobacter sp.]
MKTLIKTSIGGPFLRLYFTAVALGLLALCPGMQAVSPPPDGGYPGQNTAEGQSALSRLAGGTYNTALGWATLGFNVTGNFNTAVGAATLLNNTGDENTATGAGALLSNTSGDDNTANGAFALFNNTAGHSNTATGADALLSNTTGTSNTANGIGALHSNTTGGQNTANGAGALFDNTAGAQNTAMGDDALANNTTGGNNIALGFGAAGKVMTASNVICIGASGNNVDNSCYVGNIFGATASNGVAVLVNSNGRLGTVTSSKRFKQDIKRMDNVSEALYSLKPVSFRYQKQVDPEGTSATQLGLVAEDVEKVNPNLVVRDKEGKPYSVRYDQVNAMLLNEFLKEHKTVQELKNEIAELITTVKEQAEQIEKVSARLEVSERRSRTVLNNPQNDRER